MIKRLLREKNPWQKKILIKNSATTHHVHSQHCFSSLLVIAHSLFGETSGRCDTQHFSFRRQRQTSATVLCLAVHCYACHCWLAHRGTFAVELKFTQKLATKARHRCTLANADQRTTGCVFACACRVVWRLFLECSKVECVEFFATVHTLRLLCGFLFVDRVLLVFHSSAARVRCPCRSLFLTVRFSFPIFLFCHRYSMVSDDCKNCSAEKISDCTPFLFFLFAALGTADELNSFIGVARSFCTPSHALIAKHLTKVCFLFTIFFGNLKVFFEIRCNPPFWTWARTLPHHAPVHMMPNLHAPASCLVVKKKKLHFFIYKSPFFLCSDH